MVSTLPKGMEVRVYTGRRVGEKAMYVHVARGKRTTLLISDIRRNQISFGKDTGIGIMYS